MASRSYITIDSLAATGYRNVSVKTGSEFASEDLLGAFWITSIPAETLFLLKSQTITQVPKATSDQLTKSLKFLNNNYFEFSIFSNQQTTTLNFLSLERKLLAQFSCRCMIQEAYLSKKRGQNCQTIFNLESVTGQVYIFLPILYNGEKIVQRPTKN